MMMARNKQTAGGGFTLVETLLSVVLVGLLITAVVVNFVGLERSSKLNEGATQVEALFHFARAHAANTGRIVQIRSESPSSTNSATTGGNLVVVCEADPIKKPGEFAPIPQSQTYIKQINDSVCVEEFKIVQAEQQRRAQPEPAPSAQPESPVIEEEAPYISFFPDGSSDSAEIVLLSLAQEEPRKVLLRVSGILGTVERNPIYSTNSAADLLGDPHSYETVLP